MIEIQGDVVFGPSAAMRPQVLWYQTLGDFFNTLKAFIGTNYQALPFAFHNSGLALGIAGVALIALLTDHCCMLLIKSKNLIIERVCREKRENGELNLDEEATLRQRLSRTISYGDIGKHALGKSCFHLIQFAVWFTQFMTCISYLIFIGNTVYEIFPMVPISYIIRNASNNSVSPIPTVQISQHNQQITLFHSDNSMRVKDKEILPYHDLNIAGNRNGPKVTTLMAQLPIVSKYSASNNSLLLSTISSTLQATYDDIITTTKLNEINATTITPTNVTTITPQSTPSPFWISTAPDLKLIILFPVIFFIVTSLFRKLRYISPFSSIATVALVAGAVSVLASIALNFKVEHFEYWKLKTLPLFFGQLIGAYEGIGCIIPIQSSMEGNRHLFPALLHTSVVLVFFILCTFGALGYICYGEAVQQIIVLNIPQAGIIPKVVDVTLVISVLFTYPLQCYPVIEIVEHYFFTPGKCCGKSEQLIVQYNEVPGNDSFDDDDDQKELVDNDMERSIEASASGISATVPDSVPGWKRNLVRIILTCIIAGLAIAARNVYAYMAAFTGAVGSSLLAFILPCLIQMKLQWSQLDVIYKVKDILIIIFAIGASIATLIAIGIQITNGEI